MTTYKLEGTFSVEDFEVDGKSYTVEGIFKGHGYYDPGRMYMPNGDPGYPPEGEDCWDDWEIDDAYYYDPQKEEDVSIDYKDMPKALAEKIEETLDDLVAEGEFTCQDDDD